MIHTYIYYIHREQSIYSSTVQREREISMIPPLILQGEMESFERN